MMTSSHSFAVTPNVEEYKLNSTSGDKHGTSDTRRTYSGSIQFGDVDGVVLKKLSELTDRFPFLELAGRHVEIEYQGRDTSRVVVRTLLELARLARTASGDVECEVAGGDGSHWFEYYEI